MFRPFSPTPHLSRLGRILWMLSPLAATLMSACGAGQTVSDDFIEVLHLTPPTLSEGKLQQHLHAIVPRGEGISQCRIQVTWEGTSSRGRSAWLAPTEVDLDDAIWEVTMDVTERAVVRAKGTIRCNGRLRTLPFRYAMSDLGRRQYCEMCPDRVMRGPEISVVDTENGIAVFARPGVRMRVVDNQLVDDCSGDVLLDASAVPNTQVTRSNSLESEAESLFHHQNACSADAIISGGPSVQSADYEAVVEQLRRARGIARIQGEAPLP